MWLFDRICRRRRKPLEVGRRGRDTHRYCSLISRSGSGGTTGPAQTFCSGPAPRGAGSNCSARGTFSP